MDDIHKLLFKQLLSFFFYNVKRVFPCVWITVSLFECDDPANWVVIIYILFKTKKKKEKFNRDNMLKKFLACKDI